MTRTPVDFFLITLDCKIASSIRDFIWESSFILEFPICVKVIFLWASTRQAVWSSSSTPTISANVLEESSSSVFVSTVGTSETVDVSGGTIVWLRSSAIGLLFVSVSKTGSSNVKPGDWATLTMFLLKISPL